MGNISKITIGLFVFVLLGVSLILVLRYFPMSTPENYTVRPHLNFKQGAVFNQNVKYISINNADKKLKKGLQFNLKVENEPISPSNSKQLQGVNFGTRIMNTSKSNTQFVDENPFETMHNHEIGLLRTRSSVGRNVVLSQYMVGETSQHASYKIENNRVNSMPTSSMGTYISSNNATSNNSKNQPQSNYSFSTDLKSLQTLLLSKQDNPSFGPDPGGPGDTGDDMGEPVAPVPDGFWFLMLLGAMYAGRKFYKYFQLIK